jgi:hypothetical protein
MMVVNSTGAQVSHHSLPTQAEPFLSVGMFHWYTAAGSAGLDQSSIPSITRSPDKNTALAQPIFTGGLPENKYLTFGSLSELITVIDGNNSIISEHRAHLDDAYKNLGLPIGKSDSGNGLTRVIWADVTTDGQLAVCLSDTPMSGPAYIAMFKPEDGSLSRVVAAVLPQAANRKKAKNPSGYIVPMFGSVGDHIVVADPEMYLVAFY